MTSEDPSQVPTLTLTPIGFVRSPFVDRAEAPRQPRASELTCAQIELVGDSRFERALFDLEGWDYLWVLFWFHKNTTGHWRAQVLPPRSDRRRGVFSTRAPHRPNPLGLSLVKLQSIKKSTVYIEGCDLLDGTPVFDIKPYVPWSDAVPHARTGWLAPPEQQTTLDDDGRPQDPRAATEVLFEEPALTQLAWLSTQHIVLEPRIRATLALGTKRHPYRRIQRDGAVLKLAVKEWRVRFREQTVIEDGIARTQCVVYALSTGYRAEALARQEGLDVHRAFVALFGMGFSR
jgi:tRNA-Thr(GGU) m(6)t(6)A37 methyltransferase TsaA